MYRFRITYQLQLIITGEFIMPGNNQIRYEDQHLTVRDISLSFRKKRVLEHISFEAASHDCVGIVGRNGSGKSTLLSILAGISKPASGSFQCGGHEMFREKSLFPRMIGYLPQENPLLEDLTAMDNLRLWYGRRVPDDLPVLDELLLREMLPLKVKALSGGMKRRLAIACAVAEGQRILILDELTSALDLYQKEIIGGYIRSYTEQGGIVILSTHDEQEIRMCSTLFYLENAKMREIGAEEAITLLKGA